MRSLIFVVIFALSLALVAQNSFASYNVTGFSTTVTLNTTGSASVTEVLSVTLTNSSISQYNIDRSALNLTLSQWQEILGPTLTQHIINVKKGVHAFKLLPGPVTQSITGQYTAQVIMLYDVYNVTAINQTAPRTFYHTFNSSVFNFQHAASGEVLPPNAQLTIILPYGSKLLSVFPLPDSPSNLLTSGDTNVTQLTWNRGEPLSKFTLTFTTTQSLQAEVIQFFTAAYNTLGIFTYIIIGIAILLFIVYTYLKTEK
ncbi:MAG: hypothetical protein M1528_00895 [Candidatus Marsarchaeota archaeon]|jgi:hypothetical protein|nr:hypothetical protein [Candidatus Marsarchaeota archaeon]MCL5115076.1 hypothetical protein [Candidatus Marsarchaeota archaeon]